jgi:hypothetical protein
MFFNRTCHELCRMRERKDCFYIFILHELRGCFYHREHKNRTEGTKFIISFSVTP